MRSRRARLVRLAVALTNLVAALACLVAVGLLLLHDRPPPPPKPKPIVLPDGFSMDFEESLVPIVRAPAPTPIAKPSAYEDLMILLDAPQDFAQSYRVIFASFDDDPNDRRCIVQRRLTGDQLVLIAGERVGRWLLLAIDPDPGEPRSVRLRFRDLKRGEDVVTVLATAL